MAEIVILIGEEMLQARLNQPRVSLEYLIEQEKCHRRAGEEFAKDVKNATSKPGPKKMVAGGTN